MESDFPAAHSMDTIWFAVDAVGHVGMFDSGETGPVPNGDENDVRDELKLFPFQLADDLAAGEVLRIKLGDKTFTPPEISAFILRQLKRNAERYFAAPVTKAVLPLRSNAFIGPS